MSCLKESPQFFAVSRMSNIDYFGMRYQDKTGLSTVQTVVDGLNQVKSRNRGELYTG